MKKLKILSVHPRRHHNFEQAFELYRAYGKNFGHVTGLFFSPAKIRKFGILGRKFKSALLKRSHATLPRSVVYTLPIWEIYHFLVLFFGRSPNYLKLNDRFQRAVAKKFAAPDVLISFDTASAYLFERWKGKTYCILDLTIGLPQYRFKVDHGDHYNRQLEDRQSPYERETFAQYIREASLADLILCGSEFVKESCLFFDIPEEKCVVLNYGVDLLEFNYPERDFRRAPLKFVFVGTLGYRKGTDILLKVWKEFAESNPGSELHFFGEILEEISPDSLHLPGVFVHGRVLKAKLIEGLKACDVFVFPTTFEGSSYAIYQAMAMQLPIITTFNSGTVIKDGVSGILIRPGDPGALLYSMQQLADQPELRQKLAKEAFDLSKKFDWENYGLKLRKILAERVPSLAS
jgi:glycosyltransferase involved in cell wall biosynthesis